MQFGSGQKTPTQVPVSKRRYPRTIFSVPFTLHHLMPGGIQTAPGISLDISEGGVGALVQGPVLVGDTVEIDLYFPERTVTAIGIVRHTSRLGSGFEFLALTAEERAQISAGSTKPEASQWPMRPGDLRRD